METPVVDVVGTLARIEENLKQVRYYIEGNGVPGLLKRMSEAEASLNEAKGQNIPELNKKMSVMETTLATMIVYIEKLHDVDERVANMEGSLATLAAHTERIPDLEKRLSVVEASGNQKKGRSLLMKSFIAAGSALGIALLVFILNDYVGIHKGQQLSIVTDTQLASDISKVKAQTDRIETKLDEHDADFKHRHEVK